MPIKLISTDFDGTLFAEFENPPVPLKLQELIGRLQAGGAKWVINTGRDLSGLLEALGRAGLSIQPDYAVIVEREIYRHDGSQYVEDRTWNRACHHAHAELFRRVRPHLPRLREWVESRFAATIYEDAYSPFCLIAGKYEDAAVIYKFLNGYCRDVPHLALVCNDVYARLSHDAYNKGTALGEIARQCGCVAAETFAAGDHLNDLPMLSRQYAHWLAAPANAVPAVKEAVLEQKGHVSQLPHGHGVAEALEFYLESPEKTE
ncbi:MAG: HAD hydrolase family protein [Verrucomicrobiota bacterium]|jgi:hydroxymethylpyrimidine pyrophosphatase-like HAD family hydrolase